MEYKYFLKFVSCEKRKSKEKFNRSIEYNVIIDKSPKLGEILVERKLGIPGSGYKVLQ